MKKHFISAVLMLLMISEFVSAQVDPMSQYSNRRNFVQSPTATVSLTDERSSNVQPISNRAGWTSNASVPANSGCADFMHATGSCACAPNCESMVPNMIGDSFGVPRVFSTTVAGNLLNFPAHITKAADNNNVLPYDRLSLSYNYFQDVPETFDAVGTVLTQNDISEYRIYGEKTFLDGMASLNVVVPIYDTVAFSQTGPNIQTGTEFGNLAFGGKVLLVEQSKVAVSTGLQIEAPTSRGFGFPTTGEVIENESWYLTPYLASLYTPNDIFFMQSFLSYRARTGRNPVTFGGVQTGEVFQQNLLLADIAAGFWMIRASGRGITGIAPVIEAHYSSTMENDNPLTFTSIYYGRRDLLNMTIGTHIEINNRHILSLGYGLPLRDNPLPGGMPTDRVFDGEFSVQFNMYRQ